MRRAQLDAFLYFLFLTRFATLCLYMTPNQSFADLMRQMDDHEFAMSILEKEGYLDNKLVNKDVYQVDVHGLTAAQTISEISDAYADALSKGLHRMKIVTGRGTGRLIDAVSSQLVQWKGSNKIETWSQTPNTGEFNLKF